MAVCSSAAGSLALSYGVKRLIDSAFNENKFAHDQCN